MRMLFIFGATLGVTCCLAAQTNYQSATTQSPALVGPATNGPTIIHAGRCDIYLKTNAAVYHYNVRVDNPQMKLNCELLTVEAPKLQQGRYNHATAETNVVIDWWDEKGLNHATADRADYTYILTNLATPPETRWQTNAFVVLTGNPVVTNAEGVYRADPIVWDRLNDVITSTNFSEMEYFPKQTNSPAMFDTGTPKANKSAK